MWFVSTPYIAHMQTCTEAGCIAAVCFMSTRCIAYMQTCTLSRGDSRSVIHARTSVSCASVTAEKDCGVSWPVGQALACKAYEPVVASSNRGCGCGSSWGTAEVKAEAIWGAPVMHQYRFLTIQLPNVRYRPARICSEQETDYHLQVKRGEK